MPSRAEVRIRVEQVLRSIVIAVLAVMLWRSLQPHSGVAEKSLSTRSVDARTLAEWSALASPPSTIQLQLDSVPSVIDRAWLGALAAAGSKIAWSGSMPGLVAKAHAIASPVGGTKVLVGAPAGSPVLLIDDVGTIDTLHTTNGAAAVSLNGVVGKVTARVKGATASTARTDSLLLHRILVIGSAGWETKFVSAALEEAGWKVDALIAVAPDARITQGSTASIDTSRYSAVVALDATIAPRANQIAEFVRTGGGLVLAPQAAAVEAMTAIRAGAVGRLAGARATPNDGTVNRSTLPLAPIVALRSDAVPLEARNGTPTVVVRRVGAGRLVQTGYEETWRWRMSGGDQAVRDYREWWTGLVSNVAYAPRVPAAASAAEADEAPLAGLVGAIGPSATREAAARIPRQSTDWRFPLFLLLTLVLLAEIASRRLRAAP